MNKLIIKPFAYQDAIEIAKYYNVIYILAILHQQ